MYLTPSTRTDSTPYARPDTRPIVLLVDNDASVRHSLEPLFCAAGWQTESFTCALEFLARPRTFGPSCLVVDVSLPDINGLELQQRLAEQGDGTPIVMVSDYVDVPTTVRAMKAGAIDFVTRPGHDDALLGAVAHAIECSRASLQKEAELRALRDRFASLTCREREVMERVVLGRLNKQVAGDLDISEITVKAHRGRMMQKMQARSLPDLVNMAARLRIAD